MSGAMSESSEKSFILTDNQQPDNPITFASEHFFRLTGFSKADVIKEIVDFQGALTTIVRNVQRRSARISLSSSIALKTHKFDNFNTHSWNITNAHSNVPNT